MRTIYLARHGKPDFPDGEKRCIGRTDLPLGEEGRGQIRALAGSLSRAEIECIYTSPLRRCVESAQILSGGRIPVRVVYGMEEIDMGAWENRTFDEIRARWPRDYEARGLDMAGFAPPGGESFCACQKRAQEVFEKIRRESRGNVLLMGHAGWNRTLIAGREGRPLAELFAIPQPYGGTYAWEEPVFDAMIVAAGLSSRMGGFKPFLEIGGKSFLEREIEGLRRGGAREIAVVTGYRADEVEAAAREAAGQEIVFLHNPAYETTKMFDSVKLGLSYYEEKRRRPEGKTLDGIFFLPVDVPLFTAFTMEYEKAEFLKGSGDVYCPYYEGAPGHPLLIRASALPALLAHDGERGLKGAYERLGDRVVHLDVTDRGCVMDADTREDFDRLEAYENGRHVPDGETCERLLAWFRTPPETVRHCRAVAALAEEIGRAVNARGAGLSLERIRAAALLHDVAKAWPDHARAGERFLSLLGHDKIAWIVGDHMDYPEEKLDELSEGLIVYAADKLVQGERRVTPEERFGAKRERFKEDPQALAAVERRYARAKRALETIRRATGETDAEDGRPAARASV